MCQQKKLVLSCVVLALLFPFASSFVAGGPLEPPAGPVMSTGVTLQEISNDIQALMGTGSGNCCMPRYRTFLTTNISMVNNTTIINGSGVIHKIKYDCGNGIDVSLVDQNGTVFTFDGGLAGTQFIELNLRFDGFVRVTNASNTLCPLVLLYALTGDFET